MKVLAIDVGGTHVKTRVSGLDEVRKFVSGPSLTPDKMVAGVKELAKDWEYDVASVGYPGPVLSNRPIAEPHNLAAGWTGFDFEKAFGHPVKVVNDAAMQALGSYKGGKMLFLGLGTGLGTTLIVDGILEPMELGHLPYKKRTYEDYAGLRGLERLGKKKWRKCVFDIVAKLTAALEPDDVVLGGGNVANLVDLPPGCRAGDNANAFIGGFRLWEKADEPLAAASAPSEGPALAKAAKKASKKASKKSAKASKKATKETSKTARASTPPKKSKQKRSTTHVDQPNVTEDSPTPAATSVEEPGNPLPEVAELAPPEPVLGGSEEGGEAHG
ncbi:MAG: ROK family protein [Bryobacteraceae bacterium]